MQIIMRMLRRLKELLVNDDEFLESIEITIGFASKILTIAMIFVIFIAIAQLGYTLFDEVFLTVNRPSKDSFNRTLFELFGLVLNVLIAIEILENITAYLKKHVFQAELVIVTSLIAVSRKIIILDLEKKSSNDLIALAIAVFALSIGYAIVRQTNKQ
jgi:uncharacterized membrane protein (DUF373 family)